MAEPTLSELIRSDAGRAALEAWGSEGPRRMEPPLTYNGEPLWSVKVPNPRSTDRAVTAEQRSTASANRATSAATDVERVQRSLGVLRPPSDFEVQLRTQERVELDSGRTGTLVPGFKPPMRKSSDFSPLYDPLTEQIVGYARDRQGHQIIIDIHGRIVQEGEAPIEPSAVQPDDLIPLGVAKKVATTAASMGAKALTKAAPRVIGRSTLARLRHAAAAAMLGTTQAAPILGNELGERAVILAERRVAAEYTGEVAAAVQAQAARGTAGRATSDGTERAGRLAGVTRSPRTTAAVSNTASSPVGTTGPALKNNLAAKGSSESFGAVIPRAPVKTDVRGAYTFTRFDKNGFTYKQASGRLGEPGAVRTHRSASAQSSVSRNKGDDAGHLIGNRFGAPGGVENLTAQNWKANRYGTYKNVEDDWAAKRARGVEIDVEVTDVSLAGSDRPFVRKVRWTETTPDGRRTSHELDFANTHTPESRAKRGIPPTDTGGKEGDLIQVDFQNRKRVR